ncbi:MAG: hypothetical protein CMJ25_16180, partial [Phycisphaerae bacterium]|nr:hypothetical protein [Phycisphaerae bacterium]
MNGVVDIGLFPQTDFAAYGILDAAGLCIGQLYRTYIIGLKGLWLGLAYGVRRGAWTRMLWGLMVKLRVESGGRILGTWFGFSPSICTHEGVVAEMVM